MTPTALDSLEVNFLIWIQNNLRCRALTLPMTILSYLGTGGLLWIAFTIALICVKKTRRTGLYCAFSMILTLIIVSVIIKPLAGRVRPYETFAGRLEALWRESDKCFPSGHASNSFAWSWVIFRRMDKKYGISALALSTLIAFSRLYIGVHYPTDILAGIAIGIIDAELVLHFATPYVRKIQKFINKKTANWGRGKGKKKKAA